jgi:hypothetical protein
MDILAHALWAGVGTALASRKFRVERRSAVLTIALAVLPDALQLLPIVWWVVFGAGSVAALNAYAMASPGLEPSMPPSVTFLAHHLHCLMHSAVVAGAVTGVLWLIRRTLWIPLLGWWSHIVIDVFTHSTDYYPAPALYPITERGFDGLAWNLPWFLALNYAALSLTCLWLVLTRKPAQTAK